MQNLINLLKKKKIWCLNIGETYHVSNQMWLKFCNELPNTYVTHLYVSEHTIDLKLKNKMRDNIRKNRKKHTKHCNPKNLAVIERCTNCWWNPINTIKHIKERKLLEIERIENERIYLIQKLIDEKEEKKRKHDDKMNAAIHDPSHNLYWRDGNPGAEDIIGGGGWKFECICGEVCSSYENWRYHPVGRQFECVTCKKWCHVACVYGNSMTDSKLKTIETRCKKCVSSSRRDRLRLLRDSPAELFAISTTSTSTSTKSTEMNYKKGATSGASNIDEKCKSEETKTCLKASKSKDDSDKTYNNSMDGLGGSAGGAFDNLDLSDNDDDDDDNTASNDADADVGNAKGTGTEIIVAQRCEIYWPLDKKWYSGYLQPEYEPIKDIDIDTTTTTSTTDKKRKRSKSVIMPKNKKLKNTKLTIEEREKIKLNNNRRGKHEMQYDDGTSEYLDITKEEIRFYSWNGRGWALAKK